MDGAQFVALMAVGACAGVLSTLLGIGGGLVMVPLLHYGLGFGFVEATGLSLVAMAVQTPSGVWQHARRGAVDWRLGAQLAGGGAFGIAAGLWLQPRLPVAGLKALFAGVMTLAAWRLVMPAREHDGRMGAPAVVGIGAVAGLASKLLGIGGGLVTVPALALGGVPMLLAVGSSLVAVFTNASLASAVWLGSGFAGLAALPVALGALALSPVGTWIAHTLPTGRLRSVFAGVMAIAALAMLAASGIFR